MIKSEGIVTGLVAYSLPVATALFLSRWIGWWAWPVSVVLWLFLDIVALVRLMERK